MRLGARDQRERGTPVAQAGKTTKASIIQKPPLPNRRARASKTSVENARQPDQIRLGKGCFKRSARTETTRTNQHHITI